MTRRWARGIVLALASLISLASEAAADRIRVELDKYILVRLEADADAVFVGNPAVADVIVQSPRRIFVLGVTPGETSLRVLDYDGKDILVSNIVVVPIEERSVTVNRNVPRRSTAELTYSCDPRCALVRTATSVEVAATSVGGGAPASAEEAAAASAAEPLIPASEE
jgi:Flp pilus assembly secretin CpaC